MPLPLSKDQKSELIASIRRFFAEKLEREVSELETGFILDYFFTELGPFAYNKGVEDAQQHLSRLTEDLPGTCFQEPLTFWETHRHGVRRKPEP